MFFLMKRKVSWCPILSRYLMKLTKAAQKAVLKNSAICAGKHVLESLFHEVADFQAFNFTEKRFQNRCFSVAKFLRNIYIAEYLRIGASELILVSDCSKLLFLDSRFQKHPDSVILQKYQWLSNQSFFYKKIKRSRK